MKNYNKQFSRSVDIFTLTRRFFFPLVAARHVVSLVSPSDPPVVSEPLASSPLVPAPPLAVAV